MHLDHYFAYEMMLPLLEITIRSSSETLKNICCETYKLLVFQASLQKATSFHTQNNGPNAC